MVGFDVKVVGAALLLEGLSGYGTVDGIALTTFGFLFECSDIWSNGNKNSLSTSWANANPSVTTTWADANPSVTTTWTTPSGGIYGDC